MVNPFTPVPYQLQEPTNMETQLAGQVGNPSRPFAMPMLNMLYGERAGAANNYNSYMSTVNALQRRNMDLDYTQHMAQIGTDALSKVGTVVGGIPALQHLPLFNGLFSGTDLSQMEAGTNAAANAKNIDLTGSGLGRMADAGLVPEIGQRTNVGGLTLGTTGLSSNVQAALGKAIVPTASKETTSLKGPTNATLSTTTVDKTTTPLPGMGSVVTPLGAKPPETPLPGRSNLPLALPPKGNNTAAPAAPTTTAAGKPNDAQQRFDAAMLLTKVQHPEVYDDIVKNHNQFTLNADGSITARGTAGAYTLKPPA